MTTITILIIIGYIIIVYVAYYILRKFIYTKSHKEAEVVLISFVWPISLIALPLIGGFVLIEEYLLDKNKNAR